MKDLQRRDFIKAAAATVGTFTILPSGLWGRSPNGKICVAGIGVGGMGGATINGVASHKNVEVLAICDVDKNRAKGAIKRYKNAKFYHDYRELLSAMGDKIDAVTVGTPDHTHYPATVAAMNMGKHAYTQKPLVHSISEARGLKKVAKEKKLVTQMGIQIQSSIQYRLATHYLRSGAIGKVSKVYVWSGKNWGYDGPAFTGADPIPENLKWNLWLGTAPQHDYKKGKYHPGQWRRYLDFGCGTLGDMGVHIFDTPMKALELAPPNWVKTTCRKPTGFGHPTKNIVRYGFAETKYTTKELLWTWYDGAYVNEKDKEPDLAMPKGRKLPRQGAMFVGEKGRMLLPHIDGPRLMPDSLRSSVPKIKLQGINHYHQFVDAILGKTQCTANFDYAADLTETVLLGTLGNRYPEKKLEWNREAMAFTNMPEANKLVTAKHRKF